MVRETRMDKSSLIYLIFVREGENMEEEIPSMEGQFRYSIDQTAYAWKLMKAGVDKVMFFGIPDERMRWEARRMQRTELCRERFGRPENSSRKCI